MQNGIYTLQVRYGASWKDITITYKNIAEAFPDRSDVEAKFREKKCYSKTCQDLYYIDFFTTKFQNPTTLNRYLYKRGIIDYKTYSSNSYTEDENFFQIHHVANGKNKTEPVLFSRDRIVINKKKVFDKALEFSNEIDFVSSPEFLNIAGYRSIERGSSLREPYLELLNHQQQHGDIDVAKVLFSTVLGKVITTHKKTRDLYLNTLKYEDAKERKDSFEQQFQLKPANQINKNKTVEQPLEYQEALKSFQDGDILPEIESWTKR